MRTIKDLYSAIEEYEPLVLDKYARFPSYISGNSNKLEPILSQHLFNHGFKPKYKEGKKYAICFTHDVDFIYERKTKISAIKSAAKSIMKFDFKKFLYESKNVFSIQKNEDWSLARIIELENENNISSTYYFLALDKDEVDYNYSLDSMAPYFEMINQTQSEIGLHGGHLAFNDQKKIELEKSKLEEKCAKKVNGYRNHYLRFRTPNTWKHLLAAGFTYDTTFGYADLVGYRNGLCYPFRPFDLTNNSYLDILEIPLIIMDVSFWKYMGLNIEESFFLFTKIAKDVKNLNGVLTILWHNHSMNGGELELFKRIFNYLIKDEEAWFTNSFDVAMHWKENNMSTMENILSEHFETKL